jgi:hypothetical protein
MHFYNIFPMVVSLSCFTHWLYFRCVCVGGGGGSSFILRGGGGGLAFYC